MVRGKKKSVRGCIVGPDLAVIHLVILKKGDSELPGLTDIVIPRRLGPKRASKIRKLFRLSKEDDVRKYVMTYRREIVPKEGKEPKEPKKDKKGKLIPVRKRYKTTKIQRLVTPVRLQRKRRIINLKKQRIQKSKAEAAAYARLLAQRRQEKAELLSGKSRRTSQRLSSKTDQSSEKVPEKAPPKKLIKKAAPKEVAKQGVPKTTKTTTKGPEKTIGKKGAKTAAKSTKTSVKTSERKSGQKTSERKSAKSEKTSEKATKASDKPKTSSKKSSAKK